MALVPPHGGKGLVCSLLQGAELTAEQKKTEDLKKIDISPRAKGDLIMMGIGGFSHHYHQTGIVSVKDRRKFDNHKYTGFYYCR